jgi:hypothetical protein
VDPHNDQQYLSLLRRVVANARAIITYQVGLPFGCVRMRKLFIWLRPRRSLDFPIFEDYLTAVREFSIGHDRLEWNRDALFTQDRKLEEINRAYRDPVHNACHDILTQLAAETAAG